MKLREIEAKQAEYAKKEKFFEDERKKMLEVQAPPLQPTKEGLVGVIMAQYDGVIQKVFMDFRRLAP